MPLFFIHGVNVRKSDKDYAKEAARRGRLFRDVVLKPLAARGAAFQHIEVHDIYWGDLGVSFSWKLASVPKVKMLEAFGQDDEIVSSDLIVAETLKSIEHASAADTPYEDPTDSALKRAARNDPVRFAEALLLPILLSDFELSEESSAEEGELQALLARATNDVAALPTVRKEIEAAVSDDELIRVLATAIENRFRIIANATDQAPQTSVEFYGPDFLDQVRPRIRELFGRALNLPGRALSLPALKILRPGFHRNFSRFLGDIFVYLQKRGNAAMPGTIAQRVITQLKNTPRNHQEEPTIVVTHSMGGNILYDVLTTFSPDLFLDVWISVGGQVAQFEEMKLFLASDEEVAAPARVKGIKERVGYWLNVYDATDSFSFMADPVFDGVDADLAFSTGASAFNSHGEYFGLASFHRLMRLHIEKGLKLK